MPFHNKWTISRVYWRWRIWDIQIVYQMVGRKSKKQWKAPMYRKNWWEWHVRDFLGIRKINPNEPVCHVSFYEADAYCKWAGKRFQLKQNGKKPACWNEEKQEKQFFRGEMKNQLKNAIFEAYHWGCQRLELIQIVLAHRLSANDRRCLGMDIIRIYRISRIQIRFDRYNDKWFTNQRVLRELFWNTRECQ